MISVGKGDAIIQIFPTALRFWEKLGLGPKGGKKDVTAFVLFEPDLDERQLQVEAWLTSLAAMYAVSNGRSFGFSLTNSWHLGKAPRNAHRRDLQQLSEGRNRPVSF